MKFFRTCLGLQDDFYYGQLIQNQVFARILDIVYETLPRDNLLNSACLELFEFIRRENIKPILVHIVESHRQRLQDITYVNLFENLILRYDQMQGYNGGMEGTLFGPEEDGPPSRIKVNGSRRWQGVKEMDAEEEQYFNTSDDEDELSSKSQHIPSITNGASPLLKHLIDYPDDEDDVGEESFYQKRPEGIEEPPTRSSRDSNNASENTKPTTPSQAPPERLSEKRRREDDEEDELGKLSLTKRRSSSVSSMGSATSGNFLRRKKSFSNARDAGPGKKIAISLAVKSPPVGAEQGGDGA